jgi:hypothetical protein
MKRRVRKPEEKVADFKARIAAMMRGSSRAANGLELRHAPPALVRHPADRGYYPPPRVAVEGGR